MPLNAAFQTEDLDAYDSDCDDISLKKAVLMASLSSYDSDVLFEDINSVTQKDSCHNNDPEVGEDKRNKLTNSSAPQDAMIMSMFEQMSNQVTNWDKVNQENKIVTESLSAELERYKERVKIFEQKLNVDLSSHEKFIDSQMDDMIRNRNAKFAALEQEIDSLKQTLSKNVKEKESLLQTFTVFKMESEEKENKYSIRPILSNKLSGYRFQYISEQPVVQNTPVRTEAPNELAKDYIDEYKENLVLKADLSKKEQMVEKKIFDEILLRCSRLKNRSANLELKLQHQKEAKDVSIAKLKKHIENLKGKNMIDKDVQSTDAKVISPRMFRPDLDPLSPKLLKNRDAHIDYIKHTQENADTLWELVKHARALRPLDNDLDSASSGSQARSNTKKNKISRTSSSNKMNNKVEDKPRIIKSSFNNMNRVSNTLNCVSNTPCNANVKHSMLNANSELICTTCNECMFDAIHDSCVPVYINDVNARVKSKSIKFAKSSKKKNIWKLTGKVFTDIGYRWKPTGRTFTIVGNRCPLTRITSTKVVPLKETTSKSVITQNPEVKVYSRRPKATKYVGSSRKSKIVESRISNNSEPNQSRGSNALDVPSSSLVDFRFSKFFSDLKVAFRKHTCYIRDLEGVDLLKGSRGSNLYTLSLEDTMLSSPIFLLSKTSKTKSWLWHRRKPDLSYLHVFGALCYPTNDSEDLDKLKPKLDIGILVSYSLAKKAYRIYNKRTRLIIETIHVEFNELIMIASEKFSSEPGPQLLTPGTISSRLVPNLIPSSVEEHFNDIEVAHLDNDPFFGVPILEPNSEESSSRDVIPTNVHSVNQPGEHLRKWTNGTDI
ncbi:hypothetical protein Tco_0014976 [Tanacetum coccineum]